MIEWLRRVHPQRAFLLQDDLVWSYGDVADEVEARIGAEPVVVAPSLDPESVFTVLAGIAGGGLTVVGENQDGAPSPDAALVVYTSGTSGDPKGVRLTQGNLEAAAEGSQRHLGHGAEDVWLLAMPLHHVAGISILVRQAYTGGAVRLLDEFQPADFAEMLHRDVTMVSVVPTMLSRILRHGPYDGLRAVLVGGGPIPKGLLEEASAAGLPVLPTYGMTETFGQVATLRPGAPLDYKAHPLPGVELRIEADGRIAVKGSQVSPGYVGEAPRASDWFITSDLGEVDEDGALTVLGRADTVIVTGGENVSPERVEARLVEHPGIDAAVVFGVQDDEWGERVVCGYVGAVGADELREWCAETLPGFMVPKEFVSLQEIPKTAIGKPDREALASGFGRSD